VFEGVGDPVDQGSEPGRVAGGDPGEHHPQPVLVAAPDHQAASPAPFFLDLAGVLGVGAEHRGLGDGQHPARGLVDRGGDRGVDHPDLVAVKVA
jgi:hypothetical protein